MYVELSIVVRRLFNTGFMNHDRSHNIICIYCLVHKLQRAHRIEWALLKSSSGNNNEKKMHIQKWLRHPKTHTWNVPTYFGWFATKLAGQKNANLWLPGCLFVSIHLLRLTRRHSLNITTNYSGAILLFFFSRYWSRTIHLVCVSLAVVLVVILLSI